MHMCLCVCNSELVTCWTTCRDIRSGVQGRGTETRNQYLVCSPEGVLCCWCLVSPRTLGMVQLKLWPLFSGWGGPSKAVHRKPSQEVRVHGQVPVRALFWAAGYWTPLCPHVVNRVRGASSLLSHDLEEHQSQLKGFALWSLPFKGPTS